MFTPPGFRRAPVPKRGLVCELVVTEGRSLNGWLIVNCVRHGWGYTGPEEDVLVAMTKHVRTRGKGFVSEPEGAQVP